MPESAVPWPDLILESHAEIAALIRRTRRIAVLGIKPESRAELPAHYVPATLQRMGFEIIPVPVYYDDVTEILGQRVYRRLADVPGAIDVVQVFRKSEDVPAHVDDIIARKPSAVWLQLGIRNEAAAERMARAGISVVQDLCLMTEAVHFADDDEAQAMRGPGCALPPWPGTAPDPRGQ